MISWDSKSRLSCRLALGIGIGFFLIFLLKNILGGHKFFLGSLINYEEWHLPCVSGTWCCKMGDIRHFVRRNFTDDTYNESSITCGVTCYWFSIW